MRNLLKEIEYAINAKAYYPALITAVSVPDICAALDSDGETKGSLYINWFNKYAAKHFETFIDGHTAWYIRCAVLHQGRLHHHKIKSSFNEIMIVTENTGLSLNNVGITHANGREYLVLELQRFCIAIYRAAIEWLDAVEQTPNYQANYDKFFKKNKQPLPWDEEGVSVIASFQ